MSYFLKTTGPDNADGELKNAYDMLTNMFQLVPSVFVAQSIRPDLLEPVVTFVNRLLIETHALSRTTKELIAAHVSEINKCAY